MPKPSPFHERTKPLCTSYRWKDWAGYYAVCSYDICHEREYNAFRQGAGVIDVTPLFKYDVSGPDAAAFLSWVTVRNIHKLKVGRVVYLCWTDDQGKVIDDGTCTRLDERLYRLTAAEPMYHWFAEQAHGFDVQIRDTSSELAALAIQGPTARKILAQFTDLDLDEFRFFGAAPTRFGHLEGVLTRTGYTGDLGYELWVQNQDAVALWDLLMESGRPFGVHPAGLDALDVCRVEAGFILMGVDYIGAFDAVIESQKSSPYEIGLGWTVKLKDREPFIGQRALTAEKARGSEWALVGLDISWDALEALYDSHGLPPALSGSAWRAAVPVYHRGEQVGRATSGAWSPILKKNLALATVRADGAAEGTVLDIEVTVEWARKRVPATVVKTPFFDPPRKKAVGDDL
jgi:aminomethyltransferase